MMNDNNGEGHDSEAGEFRGDEIHPGGAPQPALALDEDERLPWLESADDDDDAGTVDTARLIRLVVIAVALLAAIIGAIWFVNHRGASSDAVPAGGVIAAPTEPYKTEPANKGGKTFAGTGDSAFAVSEGKTTTAKLGGAEKTVPIADPAGKASDAAGAGDTAAAGGVGVQVGAYSSQATAEAGWTRLSGSHDALKGVKHRVLEGSADIGTVYRLQAVTADLASANALCATLKSSGVACQVKR